MNAPRSLFLIILLFALADGLYFFPRLPGRMASHFGASRAPNGWMTKPQFFLIGVAAIGLAAFVGFAVPRRLAATDASKLNLPNKDYWLAPERRAETLASLGAFFAWYGCGILLLETIVMHLAMDANLHTPQQFPAAAGLALAAGFGGFSVVWLLSMMLRFRRP
jgi:uncharacterized membrane protein